MLHPLPFKRCPATLNPPESGVEAAGRLVSVRKPKTDFHSSTFHRAGIFIFSVIVLMSSYARFIMVVRTLNAYFEIISQMGPTQSGKNN